MQERPTFVRGPRDKRRVPQKEIQIPPPDPEPQEPQTEITSFLVPAGLTVLGLVVMIAVSSSMGGGQTLWISMAISLPMMLGSYIVSYLNYRSQKRKYEDEKQSRIENYEAMLDKRRAELRHLQDKTREALLHNHPGASECLNIVKDRDPHLMWARAPSADDFLDLRIGLGEVALEIDIKCPEQNSLHEDPLIDRARKVAKDFEAVPDAPITLPLGEAEVAGISGPRQDVLNATRSLAFQIATHHSPHDVKIAAIYPRREAGQWAWLRWLPRVWSDDRERRYLASSVAESHELLGLLQEELKKRKLRLEEQGEFMLQSPMPIWVFFLGAPQLAEGEPILQLLVNHGEEVGARSIFLADRSGGLPKQCRVMVRLESKRPVVTHSVVDAGASAYRPDTISITEADQFSRLMAPVQMKHSDQTESIPDVVPLFDLLGVKRVEELNVLSRWRKNDPYDTMSVPMGKIRGNKTQYLDLHERRNASEPNARYGHGPNALIAGAVGAGKGEFLYSLIATLAINFPPHHVNFVIFDFLAPGLVNDRTTKALPHVVNTATNLDSPAETLRALKALGAEIDRRSYIFEQVGVLHIDDYMDLYRQNVVEELLPYTVIIVDEFPELKNKFPLAKDLFDRVAKTGRKFGFRLVLAAQKPAGEVGPGVESNTYLRFCLRVARPEDSREVIKRPDAAYVTKAGRGYLRLGEDVVYEEFQSAWSNAPYAPNADSSADVVDIYRVGLDGTRNPLGHTSQESQEQKKQLNVLVDFIRQKVKQAEMEPSRKICMPPLPERLRAGELEFSTGWSGTSWRSVPRWLTPIIGLQDDVLHHEQPLLKLDLAQHGHIYVCGGSAQDNRMALHAVIEGIIQDHTPTKLHIYALDFGSAGLSVYRDVPHMGAVIQQNETQRIKRLFHWLDEELHTRQQWLVDQGVASVREYRESSQQAEAPPALILVVDGLGSVKKENLELRDALAQIAKDGDPAGIHLVLSGDITSSSMYKILDNVKSLRIALQLGSEMAYKEVLGNYPENLIVPEGIPGRGISKMYNRLLECQIASPMDKLALSELITNMQMATESIEGSLPRPIRELPDKVLLDDLWAEAPLPLEKRWSAYEGEGPLSAPIALDNETLSPIGLGLEEDGPHFLIIGPQGKGKTTMLQTWVLSLAEAYPKQVVQFVLFDTYQKGLHALQNLPHVCHYAASMKDKKQVLRDLRDVFKNRRAGDEQKKRPAIVIVIDDFQLLESDSIEGILLDHAKQDAFLGLHIVMAEDSGNTSNYSKLRKQVLANASGAFVGSVNPIDDAGVFGLLLPHEERKQQREVGRGYLVRQGKQHLVQIATPSGKQAILERVRRISKMHHKLYGDV